MSQLWSKALHELAPYTPGEQPQDQPYIKLNTNENPYPPSQHVISAINEFDKTRLRRYPDPDSSRLKQALAERYQLSIENVFVGNGSDEVLAVAFAAFFRQSLPLLYPSISYSFYPVFCKLHQIRSIETPLNPDFSIETNSLLQENGGIVIANPNAPTSLALPLSEIERLCSIHPDSVILIDEAYIDFGGESAITLINDYPNLLVIQTFSKSRSLAGMRIGYAMGSRELIDGLDRVKNSFNSYPIDMLAETAALASLEDEDSYQENLKKIINTRQRLSEELKKLGFAVLPSATNFVFTRPPDGNAETLYQSLKNNGILIRYFNLPQIDDYLRISIGTDDEIDQFLSTLTPLIKSGN